MFKLKKRVHTGKMLKLALIRQPFDKILTKGFYRKDIAALFNTRHPIYNPHYKQT